MEIYRVPRRRTETASISPALRLNSQLMAPVTKKTLSSKENTLFKELLNLYETRQLKKGIKTADQILKKVPDHGGKSWRAVIHTYRTCS